MGHGQGLLGRRRGGPCLGPAAASRHQTHRGTSGAGGHRGGKKKLRAPAKQDALRLLRNYIVERWEMVEYPAALAKGWDIGSGPTEAMCKNLTLRLKRPGMKWDTDNAAALMNLVALREGGQWELYWQNRKTA